MGAEVIAKINNELTTLYQQPTEKEFYNELKVFEVSNSKYKDFLRYFRSTYINHSRFVKISFVFNLQDTLLTIGLGFLTKDMVFGNLRQQTM